MHVCNVTVLAGLSFVAPGAVACVVADADSGVFARRLALRFEVKNEADRDAAGRVRACGADTDERDRGGEQEQREAHGGAQMMSGWRRKREKLPRLLRVARGQQRGAGRGARPGVGGSFWRPCVDGPQRWLGGGRTAVYFCQS